MLSLQSCKDYQQIDMCVCICVCVMSLCIHTQINEIYMYINIHSTFIYILYINIHIYTLYIYIHYIYKYIHMICISLRNSSWHIVSARYYYIFILFFFRYCYILKIFLCKSPPVPTRRQRKSLKYSIFKLVKDRYWIWSFNMLTWVGSLFSVFCNFVLGYLRKT